VSTPGSAPLRREWAADLTAADLHALLRLRVAVFVVEQDCPYQEVDGRDLEPATRHLWIPAGSGVLACLRLLDEGDGTFRIGRVCTAADARGRGLSRRLLLAALAEVGAAPCVLDAQTQVESFYAGHGFVRTGPEYVEDGIPHVPMRRN
jgi:ElaA protein